MTLGRTTPLRPDIPPGANETGEKEETIAWLTEGGCRERRHGPNGHCKKLNLPIFRDSSSDNAITYDDWRGEVDNYVRAGALPPID